MPQAEKHRFYLNGLQNGLRPLADCLPAADCPPNTRGRFEGKLRKKNRELARTPPQSRHRISQTAEALEARFGGDDMLH
jgi:hypothetical protein